VAYTNPTKVDFKAYFTRDFQYAADQTDPTKVLDADIDKAINLAALNINQALFSSQAEYTIEFLWLTAHYLCNDLMTSSQGINGSFPWLTESKIVGSVSESFSIPDTIKKNPYYTFLATTRYGTHYLANIIPRLIGNFVIAAGTTTPA
jgi:hypothetical protein